MWQLTALNAAYWVSVAAIVSGVVLVGRARRAGVVDDHPICRKCKYDLFGAADDRHTCPECGADLRKSNAIQMGHRQVDRRKAIVSFVIVVLGIGGTFLASHGYQRFRARPANFLQAVTRGDATEAGRWLDLHPQFARGEFDAQTSSSHTPLQLAIVFGRSPTLVKRLLDEGANPDERNANGETALQLAFRYSQDEMVKLLLEAGADPAVPSNEGPTLLHIAHPAMMSPAAADMLIEAGLPVNLQDKQGRTPLHLASQHREPMIAKVLIDSGADIEAKDNQGYTPLHYAMAPRGGSDAACQLLIKHGALLTARANDGKLPGEAFPYSGSSNQRRAVLVWLNAILQARIEGTLDHMKAQLKAAPEILTWDSGHHTGTLLQYALSKRDAELFAFLLDAGADPNHRNLAQGRGPLHTLAAMRWNGQDGLKLLIAAGADVNLSDNDGLTPLHIAVQQGNVELINSLLAAGADPDLKNKAGGTPLTYAASHENFAVHLSRYDLIIQSLVQHGATINLFGAIALDDQERAAMLLDAHPELLNDQSNHFSRTPLHVAVIRSRTGIVEMLLARGANPNLQDQNGMNASGQTPLHHAVKNPAIVKLLLEHGADVNKTDEYGRQPLHRATRLATPEVVSLLLQHGADATRPITDGSRRTPLHFAVIQRNVEVTRLLLEHGADPTARDQNSDTPLHTLAGVCRQQTPDQLAAKIKLMAEHGADLSITNGMDQTAQDIALGQTRQRVNGFTELLDPNRGASVLLPAAADDSK